MLALTIPAVLTGCTLQPAVLLALLPEGIITTSLAGLDADPRARRPEQARVAALEAAGDWEAISAFARVQLERDTRAAHWWYVKGSAEARLGAWWAARISFENAVRYAPESLDAQCMLAQAQGETGDRAGAIRTMRQALAVSRDRAQPHFFLGEALRRDGQHAAARDSYLAALGIQPAFPEALYRLALVQERLGESDAARRTILELERTHPLLAERARAEINRR